MQPLWTGFTFKEHQEAGIRWMLERDNAGRGGLLCDEMGLGKTMQMVGLIKNGANPVGRTLLVAPVAVLGQWSDVIRKSGMGVTRCTAKRGWQFVNAAVQVCMIGYEMAARNPSLISLKWDRVIYDEAHRLASNNKSTAIAKTAIATSKWLLTATPVVNRAKDIKTLLSVIGPTATVEDSMLARTMDQLRATMPGAPPKPVYHTHSLNFATDDEAQFYKCMNGVIQKRWNALKSDSMVARLQLFMRLRQLSLHPQVYIGARKKALGALYERPDWVGSSTKFDAIEGLVGNGRWIIFCHFHAEMDMLKELIGDRAQIYSGKLNAEQKADVIDWSHQPGDKVLLVQLQSGGVGLNLQHFNRVLFTGPWWTQALMDQAVGRAVRIGQSDVVEVHHLILKEEEAMNIDKYIQEKATEKGDLCRAVLAAASSVLK